MPLRTCPQLQTQKSHRTRTVEQIQRNHKKHRNSAIEIIQQQQAERRTSLHARLQARQKAKHSDVLAKTQIFSELSVASRALIVDAMEFEVMNGKGTDVCVQGAVADMFYLIIVGSCGIFINDQQVGTLHELDVFGEKALFSDTQGQNIRGATVRLVTDELHVLTLKKKKFDALIASGQNVFDMKCMAKLKVVLNQREKNDRERDQQQGGGVDNQSGGLRNDGSAGKDTDVGERVERVAEVEKVETPEQDNATLEYVQLIQSVFKSIGKRKLDKLKKAGSKKGLHNVSMKLMKQLIHKLRCAPPTDLQMAAILKDAGVELPATSMTWSEFFLWLS